MMTNDDNELNEFIQDDEVDEVDERLLPDSDEDIIALMDDNEVMEEIIERLTKERDEARRMYCDVISQNVSYGKSKTQKAEELGWDCYKWYFHLDYEIGVKNKRRE
jgi:hypothetical protein